MSEPYLSVIIPSFNEEDRLGPTLEKITAFLSKKKYPSEIIVVDDGSRDGTARLAEEKLNSFPHRVLSQAKNRGKGEAVKRGMLDARGKFLLFTDADLSTPIEEVERLIRCLEDGYDIAIGSRGLRESRVEVRQNFVRESMGKIFNRIARLFTFKKIKDSQCGFKCFGKKAAKELFSLQKTKGFSFDAEIIYLAQKKDYKIAEIPVLWRNSPNSRVHMLKDSLRMLGDLLVIRWLHFPSPQPSPQRGEGRVRGGSLLLGAILALGLALRVTGVPFGLPHLYHADEPIVVNHALAYGAGDFNPHFFKIPPLVSCLLFVFYGLSYLAGRGAEIFEDAGDFEFLFLKDPTFFYLSARLIFGALLGTFSVWLLYRLIRGRFSEKAALLSAFFLAVNFLHVRDSHYIYADIPLLPVLIGAFFFLFNLAEGKGSDWKNHLAAGAFIGLATATKYNGVALIAPYLAASLLPLRGGEGYPLPVIASDQRERSNPRDRHASLREARDTSRIASPAFGGLAMTIRVVLFWFLAASAALAVYTLLNPFTWLDFNFFWKEVSLQSLAAGHTGFLHHLRYSLHGAVGPGLLAAGFIGIGMGLWGRERKRLTLLAFILPYYFLLVFKSQPYDRYVLPLIPFFIFFAADFISLISPPHPHPLPFKGRGKGEGKWLLVTAAVLLASPGLAKAVLSDALFLKKDVRDLAKEWVESEIPSGSKLALEWQFFAPRLQWTKDQLKEKLKAAEKTPYFSKVQERRIRFLLTGPNPKRYSLYFLSDSPEEGHFLFGEPTLPFDLSELKAKRVEYIFIARVQKEHVHSDFYKELQQKAELVKRFSPYRDPAIEHPMDRQPLTGGPFLWKELVSRERNGQPIEVYRLR